MRSDDAGLVAGRVRRRAPIADTLVAALPAAALAATLAALAPARGGYFAESWGWATISLAALAALALVLRERVEVSRLELMTLAALAALAAWTLLSALWSDAPSASVRESERTLIYVAGIAAILLATPRRAAAAVVVGILAATAGTVFYSLADTLLEARDGVLVEPIGYTNALGILAVTGLLIAIGFAAHADRAEARAGAAALGALLPAPLLLTSSRGSWLALAAGAAFTIALDPARRRLLQSLATITAIGVAGAAAAGLWERGTLPAWAAIVVLAVAAALAAAVFTTARLRRPVGLAPAVVVLAAAVAAAAVVAAAAPSNPLGEHRPHYWRVAWDQFEANSALGSGAGTFERYWNAALPIPFGARDAHNLYLETLAELGPVGLVLLLAVLAPPVVAAVRTRGVPLIPAAAGAYVAYLLHAGLDWDWELPLVTLAGLSCGASVLIAARSGRAFAVGRRTRVLGVVLALTIATLGALSLLHQGGLAYTLPQLFARTRGVA